MKTESQKADLYLIDEDKNKESTLEKQPHGSEIISKYHDKDHTENTSKEIVNSSHIIEFEKWDCIVKEINTDGIRVYATDSKKQYTSRYFTIKDKYFEIKSLESIKNINEGQRIELVFKRIKSGSGQETNAEEINVYKRLRKPEWQLKMEVDQQMKDLEFIFQK